MSIIAAITKKRFLDHIQENWIKAVWLPLILVQSDNKPKKSLVLRTRSNLFATVSGGLKWFKPLETTLNQSVSFPINAWHISLSRAGSHPSKGNK